MYETGTDNCPVKSFLKYLSKCHSQCESIFQRPKDSFNEDDETWYEKRPLRKNKLGNMMSELSRAAALSKYYTNNCIRATAISALDRAGYEAETVFDISVNTISLTLFSCDDSQVFISSNMMSV
jgi:hypothetical protein